MPGDNPNIDPSAKIERKAERVALGFEDYENICNFSNDSSRRRGILSGEIYEEIVKDPDTGFIELAGRQVPVFMDIKHGMSMGYDTEKCKKYAEDLSENVKILTLPFHELNDDEKMQVVELLKSSGNMALYFSDHNEDESSALKEMLDKIGVAHKEKPLIDPRAKEGDEQAAILLFSCSAKQTERENGLKKLSLRNVYDFYKQNLEPSYSHDGQVMTRLDVGSGVDDETADKLWNLYNDRFNFLGDNHPISMQDSKGSFFDLLRSENTIISSVYSDTESGKKELTCFTYFVDGISDLVWLNQDYIKQNVDNDESANCLFTPGMVSSGIGASYAPLSIGLFAKACDLSGLSAIIIYENTNLSKRYVPRIVDRAIHSSCKNMVLETSRSLDKTDYRLWSIGGGGL